MFSFPMETRAMAIAFFYAIGTGLGGIIGPILFGKFIEQGRGQVAFGYYIGAGLMIAAGLVELVLGHEGQGGGDGAGASELGISMLAAPQARRLRCGWSVSGSGGEESLEERTVTLEGGALVLGGDVGSLVPLALQPAALVGKRFGQVLHELGHERVGLLDRLTWRVDEAVLHVGPAGPEGLGVVGCQQMPGLRGGIGGAGIGGCLRRGRGNGCQVRVRARRRGLMAPGVLLQRLVARFDVGGHGW
jgi:hypothetical protein